MFVGIEIGGTKLQLGVGSGDGTIQAIARLPVDPSRGAAGILHQMTQAMPRLLASAGVDAAEIDAAGIGFGGPVDAARGVVTRSHQIEGWAHFDLADWARREFGWPAAVHNDADTAGLAEACFGAGRELSPIFYITIGSGIGGALIIDRQIYRGAGAGAAELGHLVVPNQRLLFSPQADDDSALLAGGDPDRQPATVESLCSGWAIEREARRVLEARLQRSVDKSTDSSDSAHQRALREAAEQIVELAGGQLRGVSTELVGSAAKLGNSFAREFLGQAAERLGWAIAQMITLLCPRRVVIGGGVSLLGEELLLEPIRRAVERFAFAPFHGQYDIVPAALGESVVVHGALKIAKDHWVAQSASRGAS